MITTIGQAMDFIYSTTWKGSVLGLSRMEELMRRLGNPQAQDDLKFVHIAGTNGKGSTAAMLDSVFRTAGYRVGLFTSPYISFFGEMIQVDGEPVSDDALVSLANEVQKHAAGMEDAPTEYEIITALAFLHFYKQKCGIVVLEVGMGGRLDCTNVIKTPEVAVITAIGLDHMAFLGGTVEKIAGEKAGIIKSDGKAVIHPQIASVEEVIRKKCAEENTSVVFVDESEIKPLEMSIDGQVFEYKGKRAEIPLLGAHQLRNAAVVMEVVALFGQKGQRISDKALIAGLKNTCWQGRFEVMRKSPTVIVDVAHNPQGIQAALDTIKTVLPGKKVTFIFGVLADKEYEEMARLLVPYAKKFFLVTPENPRALSSNILEASIKKISSSAETVICDTIDNGMKKALAEAAESEIICALGSLSMIGMIRGFVCPEQKR